MYGVHSRIGRLQLAVGQSVCINETRESSDCIEDFRGLLLIDFVTLQVDGS